MTDKAFCTRRMLLAGLGATAVSASSGLLHSLGRGDSAFMNARFVVHSEADGIPVPERFTGLSYESAQLTDPRYFSADNKSLIRLVRALGPGVLRIGGNTSDLTVWNPPNPQHAAKSGANKAHIPISPRSIESFAGFLDATGWHLLYGLNLGTGTPSAAAAEAEFVARTVGNERVIFQIGNEPDLFVPRLRSAHHWDFPQYLEQWLAFAQAVRARVPRARFGAPDTAEVNGVDWILPFAQKAAREVELLSGHYYAEGPPSSSATTIARLLAPDPRLAAEMHLAQRASALAHRPVRMTETNSCFEGGKADVSNTFASALWGCDYMLALARAGYCGVNFHGGGSGPLSAALGGAPLTGQSAGASRPEVERLNGWYTPIAGSVEAGFWPRPLYYGMLLASHFDGAFLLPVSLQTGGRNLTAYAARSSHGLYLAVVNKEASTGCALDVAMTRPCRVEQFWRLEAPALDSISGVRFQPTPHAIPQSASSHARLSIPPASAALMLLQQT